MIRPLRQRHRRSFIALAVLIPLLFVWGIIGRRSIPLVHGDGPPTNTSQETTP
jgi:hypothetical protein